MNESKGAKGLKLLIKHLMARVDLAKDFTLEIATIFLDLFTSADDVDRTDLIKTAQQMTKEEWAKHQVTHTPYMASCKHCVAARAVRQQHPEHGNMCIW